MKTNSKLTDIKDEIEQKKTIKTFIKNPMLKVLKKDQTRRSSLSYLIC